MQELQSNNYEDFLARGKLLTNKLWTRGYVKPKLITVMKKFYGRHHDIVLKYDVSVSKLINDTFDTN